MELIKEGTIRQIDNLGRITLPKSLRDRMYLSSTNNKLEIFTAVIDGRNCICLASPVDMPAKLLAAAEIFEECGVELTDEMRERIKSFSDSDSAQVKISEN